jgi:hypothetical protein
MPGRGICSVLFLCTFCWSILRKPTIATSDIYLFGVKITPDEAIRFKDLELITDHFNNLSLSPRGMTPMSLLEACSTTGCRHYMPSSKSHPARMNRPRARERALAFLSQVMQHGDFCHPHRDYTTAGGNPSISDDTSGAIVDCQTSTRHKPPPPKQPMAHQEERWHAL